jgi:DNA polymerase-3 subunit delta'
MGPGLKDFMTVRRTRSIGNRQSAGAPVRRLLRLEAVWYLEQVPLLPLYGHAALRKRFKSALTRNTLPASLLLQGPRGVGKQQLALWLARLLLCESADRAARPCGVCKPCRMAAEMHLPDLHWFFPRPRLKDTDPDPEDIEEDIAGAIAERLQNGGVYEPPGGDEAIFVATVRTIVHMAALAPAMGHRKVFVIGDAERMVAQEGSDQAANAFLKLLEEPPANTMIILTSSEPGALLPTVRSRVVAVRVAPLSLEDVRAFLADPTVAGRLDFGGQDTTELLDLAAGAPGRLIARDAWTAALGQARRLLDAAASPDRGTRMRVALAQGSSGARGKFSDTLDALTVLVHERSRAATGAADDPAALGAAKAMDAIEQAKELAGGNVSPQLVAASLLQEISPLIR